MESSQEECEKDEGFVVEIGAEEAAQLFAMGEMLNKECIEVEPGTEVPSLRELLLASGAPLRLEEDPEKGLRLVASRSIAAGEVILEEVALATSLCRSPGSDGVFSMTDREGRVVATLPPWALMRSFRDTLTFSPQYALRAETGYGILLQMSALGGREHADWAEIPTLPPGLEGASGACCIPPRVQLLQAIAQSNAFCVALPVEDSNWKRGLLWPLLARVQEAGDRERFFDDAMPFTSVSAFFILGALFNHSCAPNVTYTECAWAEGDESPHIKFVASRDLGEGEELLHSYIDSSSAVQERRKKLLLTYRFRCRCGRCLEEAPELLSSDPLEKHFPHGIGPKGLASFYERGGRFPKDDPDEHPPATAED